MKDSEDMDLLDSHIRGVMMTMNAAGKCRGRVWLTSQVLITVTSSRDDG